MTDESERDQARSQRPAPPYVRRPGDTWREELPPITHFVYDRQTDPSEPVFEPVTYDPKPRETVPQSMEWSPAYSAGRMTPPTEREESVSWILEEWEQYDWKAAATLTADPEIIAAQQAWGDLDWDEDERAATGSRQRTPEMVATILEGIANRVRSGDVRVNGSPGMTDAAALTAVLAALLGVKR